MRYSDWSDEELRAAAGRGDAAAFAVLYCRYNPRLLGFFRNRGCSDDAWDLASETWLRDFRYPYDPDRGTKYRTWLFRLAHGVRIDFLRRQGVGPEMVPLMEDDEDGQTAVEFPYEEPGLEEIETPAALSAIVREALESLPDQDAEILGLCDVAGLTLGEAAQALGILYGTAGRRLHEARGRLRCALEARGYRIMPQGTALPPGTQVLMRLPEAKLIVQLDLERLRREGLRSWPADLPVPHAGIDVTFEMDETEVWVRLDVEALRRDGYRLCGASAEVPRCAEPVHDWEDTRLLFFEPQGMARRGCVFRLRGEPLAPNRTVAMFFPDEVLVCHPGKEKRR